MATSTRHSGHSPLLLRQGRSSLPFAGNPLFQAQPSVLKGVQDCRLPGVKRLKPLKPSAAASTRHSGHSPLLLRAFEPVVCQAQPSVLKGVQAASTRHSGHSPLLLRVFNPAVCQASNPYQRAVCQAYNPYNPAWQLRPGTQAEPSVVKGVQACRLPETLKPCVAASTRHSGHSPLLLRAFKPAVCLKPLVKGVQTCRLPGSALCS